MSKASNVRDAVISRLQVHLAGHQLLDATKKIQPFWTPDFSRDDLDDGPILGVACGGREINSLMGPDETRVLINVGVFGLPDISQLASLAENEARLVNVKSGDKWDGILEDALSLWIGSGSSAGPMAREAQAGHWFKTVEQTAIYDPSLFKDERIWAGFFTVTYEDQDDQ